MSPQGSAPPPLPPTFSGDLTAFVRNELLPSISVVSGSGASASPLDQLNEYVLPTPSQLSTLRTVIQRIVAGDYPGAHSLVKTVSSTYNVLEFTDTATGQVYYLLLEGTPGSIPAPASHASGVNITDPNDQTRRGWGTYVFNPAPVRPLCLSVPHPKDDLETGEQGIETFLNAGAYSLLLAGADRDQNVALAPCDPSTRPFREADMAHTADSVFQIAFEEVFNSDSSLEHLQLHGNGTCTEDVFLSNGVLPPPVTLDTLMANIEAASLAAAPGGPTLSADVYDDPGDCALRGTKNTQLRFASGIPHSDVCALGYSPTIPSRFVHFEQLRDARRDPSDPLASPGRNRMIISDAIQQTFP